MLSCRLLLRLPLRHVAVQLLALVLGEAHPSPTNPRSSKKSWPGSGLPSAAWATKKPADPALRDRAGHRGVRRARSRVGKEGPTGAGGGAGRTPATAAVSHEPRRAERAGAGLLRAGRRAAGRLRFRREAPCAAGPSDQGSGRPRWGGALRSHSPGFSYHCTNIGMTT